MIQELDSLISNYEKGVISRRQLLAALAAAAIAPAATAASAEGFQARSLNHVTLAVSDVERSQAFYERVLGMEVVSTQANGVNMGLGDSFLGLYKIDDTPRLHHFCVGLDSYDVEQSAETLRGMGLDPYVREDKPEVYFPDPDGLMVQLENKRYRG